MSVGAVVPALVHCTWDVACWMVATAFICNGAFGRWSGFWRCTCQCTFVTCHSVVHVLPGSTGARLALKGGSGVHRPVQLLCCVPSDDCQRSAIRR
jgi:hypothetical protein